MLIIIVCCLCKLIHYLYILTIIFENLILIFFKSWENFLYTQKQLEVLNKIFKFTNKEFLET